MPRGRHLADPPQAVREYSGQPEHQHSRRYRWIVLLGVFAALLGSAYALTGPRHTARLTSESSDAPLFGASVNSYTLAPEEAQLGHMPVVRVYFPSTPPADAWTTSPAALADSAVVVSWKALPSEILSGADDAALTHFFDTAPTDRPIYYSYYHEPEDNIAAGQFSLADYKAAWAHVVALADAAHNPELHSTLILMSWDLSAESGRNFKDYIPSGNIISTLGWDAYPAGSIEDKDVQLSSPADFMGPAIAASKSVGLPYGFAEFALSTQDGRPAWLDGVAQYLDSSGALFATYFDSTGWPDMELTDTPSIQAWKAIIASSGASAPVTPTPTPTPTASTSPPVTTSGGESVTAESASPTSLTVQGHNYTTIDYTLSAGADVTVCILNDTGKIVRSISMPTAAAGARSVKYYGYDDSHAKLPSGSYRVLVVANNSQGSGTAESDLTLYTP